MLNIDEINNTIIQLQNEPTTFDTCKKLAALYIVREHLDFDSKDDINNQEDTVEKELNDIAPQYRKYCDLKRKYQLNEISKEPVIQSMTLVSKEIEEFIRILYCNTDMLEEREIINQTLKILVEKYR